MRHAHGEIRVRHRLRRCCGSAARCSTDETIAASAPVQVTIAPQPGGIPHPWQHGDIGAVGRAGSATYSDGVFSVTGSGADIWGTADAFHFLSRVPATWFGP